LSVHAFQINNTEKRYTLFIQKQADPHQNGQIEININGNDWIKLQDFTAQTQDLQKNSLLLNANNTVRVRVKGGAGVTFGVSISEGGVAGTILRSRGQLGLPGEIQATRIEQNDTNIFDPNDPGSLGALSPYQGEREDSQGNRIGAVKFNQEETLEFQSGNLVLEFLDAQAGLAFFQQRYGAEVLEEVEQRYLLKLDLSKAPIQQFPDLVRAYNQSIPGNIQELTFGSLASLQTFAIFYGCRCASS